MNVLLLGCDVFRPAVITAGCRPVDGDTALRVDAVVISAEAPAHCWYIAARLAHLPTLLINVWPEPPAMPNVTCGVDGLSVGLWATELRERLGFESLAG